MDPSSSRQSLAKTKSLSMKLPLILLGIWSMMICGYHWAEGANWRCFYFSEESKTTYYFDAESVDTPSVGIFRIWMKTVEPHGEYNKLLLEFKCKDRMFKILSAIEYNKENQVKNSYQFITSDWKLIPPESIIEILNETICL